MTATLSVAAGTASQLIAGQPDSGTSAESSAGRAGPDSGARHGASLTERGYVHAHFGGMPVLVGPELAAQLKAIGQKQRRPQ